LLVVVVVEIIQLEMVVLVVLVVVEEVLDLHKEVQQQDSLTQVVVEEEMVHLALVLVAVPVLSSSHILPK
jgi:hypothetical protein